MLKREKWDENTFKNINISDFLTPQNLFLLKTNYSCVTSTEESEISQS